MDKNDKSTIHRENPISFSEDFEQLRAFPEALVGEWGESIRQ
jgi:hypothetical protein